jgi:hypothetical protein
MRERGDESKFTKVEYNSQIPLAFNDGIGKHRFA